MARGSTNKRLGNDGKTKTATWTARRSYDDPLTGWRRQEPSSRPTHRAMRASSSRMVARARPTRP